jgi:hypothetical protein
MAAFIFCPLFPEKKVIFLLKTPQKGVVEKNYMK